MGSRPDHGQNHLEFFDCHERVGLVGRHDKHFPLSDLDRMAGDGDLRHSLNDQDQSVEWRRVFAQPLTLVEGEQGDRAGLFPDQSLTDNGTRLIGNEIRRIKNLNLIFHGISLFR